MSKQGTGTQGVSRVKQRPSKQRPASPVRMSPPLFGGVCLVIGWIGGSLSMQSGFDPRFVAVATALVMAAWVYPVLLWERRQSARGNDSAKPARSKASRRAEVVKRG